MVVPQKKAAPKSSGCTKRHVVIGFCLGVAVAVAYRNSKRRPSFAPSAKKSRPIGSETDSLRNNPSPFTTLASVTDLSVSTSAPPPPTFASTLMPTSAPVATVSATTPLSTTEVVTGSNGELWSIITSPNQRNFFDIASLTGTDKVWGSQGFLSGCKEDASRCPSPQMENPPCRMMQGHFYDTIYNRWLKKYSTDDTEPFQFLEIGFYNGKGFDAYKQFLPKAETHSIEIACLPEGPRAEGKWPYGNFPSKNPRYQEYLDTNQLHCGDGSSYEFLQDTWTTKMKRPGAPPLKVVVEDASHLADHMAKSLFFWFPKIEPGGIMVVEDVQPIREANDFRLHVLPQVLKDLHYCGDPAFTDKACFPTLWPLLQSVHCELHICVFERNEEPAVEHNSQDLAFPPPHALNAEECLLRAH